MQRGRRYARAGQVLSFDVRAGLILAQVQGSRRTPYVVTIATEQLTSRQWKKVDDAFRSRVGFIAHLLAGEVPQDLEEVFDATSVPLFPRAWASLHSHCDCPDSENPCKHIAAVLYLFADHLDDDPWLLLVWRGRTKGQLLEPVRARNAASGAGAVQESAVAPWWPFPIGPLPKTRVENPSTLDVSPDRAAEVLERLGRLDVDVRGNLVTNVLSVAYERICLPEPEASAAAPRSRR